MFYIKFSCGGQNMNMDNIMKSNIGELSNKVSVTFRKTCYIREYETEVIESSTEIVLDNPVSATERMFISALLEAQMEYTAYVNLANKGLVTSSALAERRKELEQTMNTIKYKAEQLYGVGYLDKYLMQEEV